MCANAACCTFRAAIFTFRTRNPNTLRLGFGSVDEKRIAKGVETLSELLKIEFRKRQRGARGELHTRVALV